MTPLPQIRVICIDEWGPLAVKTYPGAEWKSNGKRATFEPDYGRRGLLWVHGAFEPATGQAAIVISNRRDRGIVQRADQCRDERDSCHNFRHLFGRAKAVDTDRDAVGARDLEL